VLLNIKGCKGRQQRASLCQIKDQFQPETLQTRLNQAVVKFTDKPDFYWTVLAIVLISWDTPELNASRGLLR